MTGNLNPAFAAWLAVHGQDPADWIQLRVRRRPEGGFELRHVADADAADGALEVLPIEALRALALHTADGSFRPLRAAPNLRAGWRCAAPDAPALARALELLYPGTVADWHAWRSSPAAATSWEAFAARQTGMYRVTQTLDAGRAEQSARAACAPRFCLKRRRWTVAGRADPEAAEKSAAPCLEPCAVALELARHAARLDRQPCTVVRLAADEQASLRAALESALNLPPAGRREADLADPLNPRRLKLLLEKLDAPCDTSPPEEG